MDERQVLEGAAADVLKPLGYRKQRSTWRRAREETILVFNIQKSPWGPEFYLNLGVYLRALGTEQTPPEYRCHLRSRVVGLLDDPAPLKAALDFHSPLPPEERVQTISAALRSHALPWLEARDSEVKAREALLTQPVTGLVAIVAKRHLGIASTA
jgi:hypothetical protein